MFSTEKRVAIVCDLTYEWGHMDWTRKFRKSAPARAVIKNLVNKFKWTDSVKHEDEFDRLSIAHDLVQRVQEMIARNPKSSTWSLSCKHVVPHFAASHNHLNKENYHIRA